MAAAATGMKSALFLRALNEREWAGSTVCAKGIGMPHAVITGLKESIAILTILQDEVAYNSVDSDYMGVDVAMAFFISPHDKYETVETMLRLVGQELGNSELTNSLRRSWQDNTKLTLLLNKLDAILSAQIKPASADADEPQSTASSIIQFISDAITSIGTDKDEEQASKIDTAAAAGVSISSAAGREAAEKEQK